MLVVTHTVPFGQVADDRVVYDVRAQLQQERVRADGGGRVAGGLDGEADLINTFRMKRLPDPKPSGAAEATLIG